MKRDHLRIKNHPHDFGVAGAARADFLIGRMGREPAGISDRRHPDARQLPKFALNAPKTAHREHGPLKAGRDRRVKRALEDKMRACGDDWLVAAGQGLGGGRQTAFFGAKQHASGLLVTSSQYRRI